MPEKLSMQKQSNPDCLTYSLHISITVLLSSCLIHSLQHSSTDGPLGTWQIKIDICWHIFWHFHIPPASFLQLILFCATYRYLFLLSCELGFKKKISTWMNCSYCVIQGDKSSLCGLPLWIIEHKHYMSQTSNNTVQNYIDTTCIRCHVNIHTWIILY